MKKIFILTGEPSGDKLASTVIDKLQQNHSDIEYLSVGGSHLKKLGVKEGNKVNFTKDSEYEFIINDEKLYRMRANDICTILN